MSRPQQPEIARNGRTDVGPVPPENQPGHHPPEEQDKPDLDAFAAKLSANEDVTEGESAAVERQERQREAAERNGDAETPYMRWALYPVRLVAHAAKWSKEYFEAGRR
jgi:hypothetical protein